MSAISIQQMADRVAALMESRLGIKGVGLEAKLNRGGWRLPRRVRRAARALAEAAERAKNPKFFVQMDMERLAADYDLCCRNLGARGKGGFGGGFGALMLRLAATLALGLLVVALIWLLFLRGA